MKSNLAFVITLVWAAYASAITIETVPVGDVGNPALFGVGRVDYAYSIGKYEVTVGQYTAFLNAVAATDTYLLYNSRMATDLNIAGISQSGASGNFTYSVIGSANHPITYVSWGAAARFANWLHNGQPTGAQDSSTTEDGAYALNGAISVTALNAVSRRSSATWFIPSENEWYKAAYYQPAGQGGDSDNYWNYPMRTNSNPYSAPPPGATPDNTRVGNYRFGGGGFIQTDAVVGVDDVAAVVGYDSGFAVTGSQVLSPSQNYLTDAGAYTLSPSYYTTFDQGGNVAEWNERIRNTSRSVRGSSWNDTMYSLSAPSWRVGNPTIGSSNVGFRVATIIPEPSTLLLTITAFATLFICRRKLIVHNRS